ncbi:T9SS type A sorting domain-containing protein [Rubrivirga marina]|uniref:Uncharacterized protein n=1 Tax=Rubrivirga marina TaxID=1196024 RepID=A0A271IZP4_9BACT|nr:T9SS type A sorting domain-containing protein [Rubrivirga marina]PAP76692.1 hypothetical protein BSZ37_09695 [Rubrivirga marina]
MPVCSLGDLDDESGRRLTLRFGPAAVGRPPGASWAGVPYEIRIVARGNLDGETIESNEVLVTGDLPVEGEEAPAEAATALEPPYPNPSHNAVTVPFRLREAGPVRLVLLDALGRDVATLADGPFGSGAHHVRVDATGLPSGVYVVRLSAEAGGDVVTATRRLSVVR